MPSRHISQREARATAKALQSAQRRLRDFAYPTRFDPDCITELRALPIDERMRGFIEGAKEGRHVAMAARLTDDGIAVYLYTEVTR